jgi:hypothetical protein
LKFLQNRINIVNTFGHGGRSMKEALDTRNLSPLSSPEPARSATRPNLPQPPRVRVSRGHFPLAKDVSVASLILC